MSTTHSNTEKTLVKGFCTFDALDSYQNTMSAHDKIFLYVNLTLWLVILPLVAKFN